MSEIKLHRGNCHCGRNRFEVSLPEITSATTCKCGLCSKQGYLWVFPTADALRRTRGGAETLSTYSSGVLGHEFCSTCGTSLYGNHLTGALAGKLGLNVRSIIGLNPFRIPVTEDSSTQDLEPVPTPPSSLTASPPLAEVDGDNVKFYYGSCQCGAVWVTVKTRPLPEIHINEDNCSICTRNAWVGIYPDKSQVTVVGKENTTEYQFGQKFNGSPFCRTCGVHVFSNLYGPPKELVETWPAARQEMVKKKLAIQPLNVRTLYDVEWETINITRADEGTEGYEVTDQ